MISVIIAGGSGTRLWPLSTPEYPKHLLKINNNELSLLQSTYERARLISDAVYVITELGHAHLVKQQLPELDDESFIIEPARRGTASCIVAGLAHLSGKHSDDEAIAILSADHHIRDTEGFAHSFRMAGEASESSDRIVLVGVEPDYPATGFGYIQKDNLYDEKSLIYNVHSFKEKPEHKLARQYMTSGKFLWNCGYFVGSLNTFRSKMRLHSPGLHDNLTKLIDAKNDKQLFQDIYLNLQSSSIDYELIEKVDDLLVVPAAFDWMDVGSFNDLHKTVDSDELGNHIYGTVDVDMLENSFVQNYDDERPVAVIGLDNVVVINTKNGVLVARKDLSQKIGDACKRINNC